MKNNFLKMFIAILSCSVVSFCTAIGTFIAVSFMDKDNVPPSSISVSTFDELNSAITKGISSIKIVDDIYLTSTIYVYGNITVEVDSSCAIVRNEGFLGDMFIVGENSLGKNPIVETSKAASLTLKANNSATLTIDGNSENITDVVVGSAFLITNTAQLNVYDNVVIRDCKKLGNNATDNYRVSYPTEIGGAAVIITSGSFNMYGGLITNCETNTNESNSDVSTQGGAIYNNGTFSMFGGKITECKSSRGGVLYNYKLAKILEGEISSNSATVYGGAVYNPNSQYSNLYIGQNVSGNKVLLKKNSSLGSGGAIFSSIMASIYVSGATTFEENVAGDNGGAINSPGANVIKNTLFHKNEAGSKGGAMYVYHNKAANTVRHTILQGVIFNENTSVSGGGALGTGSSVSDYSYSGAKVYATNCTFTKNNGKEGGAVYIIRQCYVELIDCVLNNNSATTNGGGIYVTGKSTLVIKNISAETNNAVKGGFLYLTTGGTTVQIISGKALNNTAEEDSGSTIWTNSASVILQIHGTTTKTYFEYNGEILGKGAVSEYEE